MEIASFDVKRRFTETGGRLRWAMGSSWVRIPPLARSQPAVRADGPRSRVSGHDELDPACRGAAPLACLATRGGRLLLARGLAVRGKLVVDGPLGKNRRRLDGPSTEHGHCGSCGLRRTHGHTHWSVAGPAPGSRAGSLAGDTPRRPPAKELLLKMMQAVDRSFRLVHSYTMTFRKQERINGKLLPEQTYFIKVRQDPFAIYMRGIQPVAGRELIYAEGHYDNHVIGHPEGMARFLVPRLKVPPDHPMILAESRHPMNQAGLGNLIRKLLGFRQMDLEEPEEVTILDRTMTPDGKRWLRSTHIHPQFRPGRPLAQSEILYD